MPDLTNRKHAIVRQFECDHKTIDEKLAFAKGVHQGINIAFHAVESEEYYQGVDFQMSLIELSDELCHRLEAVQNGWR